MKKASVMSGLVCISLLATACNSTDETGSANEPTATSGDEVNDTTPMDNQEEDESNGQSEESGEETQVTDVSDDEEDEESVEYSEESEDEVSTNENTADESDYTEEKVAGDFLIYSERMEDEYEMVFHFTRTTEEMTREERYHQSLIESDPSQRDLFSAVTDFEVDGAVANVYFNEDDVLSMGSTESADFWTVLHEISFRFGIEEVNLFNQDGERGLLFAENTWDEPIVIEQEPSRGYYVLSSEGETSYVSGAVAVEEISATDDELLDFAQTVEAMATVENDGANHVSGIYEGMEIEEASINEDEAMVRYQISEGIEATEQERQDFEQVLQLAALDFQVNELRIVNETDGIISIYPLLNEIDSEGESDQNDNTEVTEDDAVGIVFDYVNEYEDFDHDGLQAMTTDEEEKIVVQIFVDAGEEDEGQMTMTLGWYEVDKETGEVEEREL